ncbi:hypothetical protein [Streptomyces silvensis]|uniref:hypothetical protein n=1 Tax=Streptomyces silvensis TaxID=1765722 RepID=UPI001F520929|nr:hypothetical protein [Streptomyces silvensis]
MGQHGSSEVAMPGIEERTADGGPGEPRGDSARGAAASHGFRSLCLRVRGLVTAGRRERAAERDLKRRLRQELRDLDVQPPLSVDSLCRALERKRRRPIVLRPYPLPVPGPLGLWVSTPGADLVFYQQHTTRMHQDHIVLHEVMGHIWCDHGTAPDGDRWGLLVPGLSPEAVRRVMTRCAYDDAQECEAERAATIITEWACVLNSVAAPRPDDPELRRVHSALGDSRGWL